MTMMLQKSNSITVDKEENKIYIRGKFCNKSVRIVDFADIISVEERIDSKVHIRKGKGGVLEGGLAGLKSGAGIIQGVRHRCGAEVIRGAKYLTVRYRYKGREKSFCLDNIQQAAEYEKIYSLLKSSSNCEI